MSKNLNTEGPARSLNQNNVIDPDEMGDGNRTSDNLKGEGRGPNPAAHRNQGEERLEELGRRGTSQGLPRVEDDR